MASTNKCEYCGSTITSADQKCPNCGASNPLYVVDTPRVVLTPHTLAELQEYCAERGMPLLRMRFFIGEDYKEPKAFGIFKDSDGQFTVYKNKADGTRAIRYQGPDETRAVSEIYLKLLEECHNRNIWPDTPDGKPPKKGSGSGKKKKESGCLPSVLLVGGITVLIALMTISEVFSTTIIALAGSATVAAFLFCIYTGIRSKRLHGDKKYDKVVIAVLIVIVIATTFLFGRNTYNHPTGYYHYDGNNYYRIGNSWYTQDLYNGNTWYEADSYYYEDILDSGRDYYIGDDYGSSDWDDSWGITDFESSSAYSDYQETHSSSSDSSSDYDSWDSGSTDWDSDW